MPKKSNREQIATRVVVAYTGGADLDSGSVRARLSTDIESARGQELSLYTDLQRLFY